MSEKNENEIGVKHHHHPSQKPGPIASNDLKCPLAYVANIHSKSVSVINIPLGIELMQIPVGASARDIDISPDGKYVYVACPGDIALSVISTESNTVVNTIDLNLNPFKSVIPSYVKVSPNNRYVYVLDAGAPKISVVSVSEKKVVTEIPLLAKGFAMDITQDGNFGYVTLPGAAQKVAVVDLNINLAVKYLNVAPEPTGISMAPGWPLCAVSHTSINSMIFINTDLADDSPPFTVGNNPGIVAFDPSGKTLYITHTSSNIVSVVDVFTHSTLLSINVGAKPFDMAVTSDGKYIVVSNMDDSMVSIIDAESNTLKYTVPVGLGPRPITILNSRKEIIHRSEAKHPYLYDDEHCHGKLDGYYSSLSSQKKESDDIL